MPKRRDNRRRRREVLAGAAAASVAGFPFVSRAQNKPSKIGMPTIQSGRATVVGS
jgi:hypothetical protein